MLSVCASCGLETFEDGLCRHHVTTGDNWAESNRLICALIHRREEPPRIERTEDEAQAMALDEASWAMRVGAA